MTPAMNRRNPALDRLPATRVAHGGMMVSYRNHAELVSRQHTLKYTKS